MGWRPARPPGKVLVVDEDGAFLGAMRALLEGQGFNVDTVEEPQSVLREVKEGAYNLVVLELQLPGTDAVQLLKQIRNEGLDVPVVVLTRFPELNSVISVFRAGGQDYANKKFEPDEFRSIVMDIMRKQGVLPTAEENLRKEIGENLRRFRMEKGYTGQMLSRRSGISVAMISAIECGRSGTHINTLFKFANILDVKVQDFFGEF